MAALEFHDPVSGRWCPAKDAESANLTRGMAREGTRHMAVKLPDGRDVTRQDVPHVNHDHVVSVLSGNGGRCTLCGVHPDNEPNKVGRVYRGGDDPTPNSDEVEAPTPAPEPETLDDAKKIAPRTSRP